jgi:hypothetical protein
MCIPVVSSLTGNLYSAPVQLPLATKLPQNFPVVLASTNILSAGIYQCPFTIHIGMSCTPAQLSTLLNFINIVMLDFYLWWHPSPAGGVWPPDGMPICSISG